MFFRIVLPIQNYLLSLLGLLQTTDLLIYTLLGLVIYIVILILFYDLLHSLANETLVCFYLLKKNQMCLQKQGCRYLVQALLIKTFSSFFLLINAYFYRMYSQFYLFLDEGLISKLIINIHGDYVYRVLERLQPEI